MSAASLTVAATATTVSNPSTSIHHFSIAPTQFFLFKNKPIKTPTLKSYHHINSPKFSHSLAFCASAAFDSVEITEEDTEEIVSEEEEESVEEEGNDDGVESQYAEAGRLYVGNLPFSVTNSELSKIFEEAGRVVSAEIVYNRVTDRSRGFAFVTMGSAEEAKEAIRLFDGSQIGGRVAKVNFPEVPKGGEREIIAGRITINYKDFLESPYKLYVGNLSWSLTSGGLKEAFVGQPGFLTAKIIYDRDTGRSRGYGFISFASAEELESAVNAMNGVEIVGRPLRLERAAQKPVLSPPAATVSSSDNDVENSEMVSSVST